jgi:TIR domain
MIKLFLSHASEDQEYFVRPLAEALKSDFQVWYSEYELTLGDPLLKKIDEGLRSCDYGIVVLSQHFFAKKWPRAELDGLFGLETTERKLILPIWKGVSEDEVRGFSPILAGYLGISTDQGMARVVYEIKRAVGLLDRQKGLEAAWKEKFSSLNADLKHQIAADALARTTDGVQQVTKVARDIIAEARLRAEALIKDVDALGLRFSRPPERTNPDLLLLTGGPRRVSLLLSFQAPVMNSADRCSFIVAIYRDRDLLDEDAEKRKVFEQFKFSPNFDRQFKVYWQSTDTDKIFSTGDALLDFAFERFAEILSRELEG